MWAVVVEVSQPSCNVAIPEGQPAGADSVELLRAYMVSVTHAWLGNASGEVLFPQASYGQSPWLSSYSSL